MSEAKKLAIEHWEWLRPVLFQAYRVGYIHNPCGEMDWNEDAIKESFEVLEPFLMLLYMGGIEHGFKHAKEDK